MCDSDVVVILSSRKSFVPWLVWLSGLTASLRDTGSLV